MVENAERTRRLAEKAQAELDRRREAEGDRLRSLPPGWVPKLGLRRYADAGEAELPLYCLRPRGDLAT
jgi:hypothetical protein